MIVVVYLVSIGSLSKAPGWVEKSHGTLGVLFYIIWHLCAAGKHANISHGLPTCVQRWKLISLCNCGLQDISPMCPKVDMTQGYLTVAVMINHLKQNKGVPPIRVCAFVYIHSLK